MAGNAGRYMSVESGPKAKSAASRTAIGRESGRGMDGSSSTRRPSRAYLAMRAMVAEVE